MKIKTAILAILLVHSILCACGDSDGGTASDTEAGSTETTNHSGNFSETMFIENPGTDTVIVEMP